ncbi:MAG: FG-GAP-like repeat-containing protein, partial [Sulfuriferula sp.]
MLFGCPHRIFSIDRPTLPFLQRAIRVFIVACLALYAGPSIAGPFSIPGKLSVNQLGAATYTVPLRVPPGTAGVVPHLELAYDSQAGNGLMGMGWSLGGLSSITRCPKTIAQDGVMSAVRFDGNDQFCMDGQRLVAVTGPNGGNGTEYRTEVESFTKVISYGSSGNGPAWFSAWTKDGRILTFGGTTDSKILAPDGTTVRIWAENKSANSKGSFFTVSYQNASGQFYPTRIDYTGNAAQSLAPYNSVQFTYEARNDKVSLYQAGVRVPYSVRLSHIQTFAGTQVADDYQLGYDTGPNTNRSRLVRVSQCGSDGTCFSATNFTFNTGIGGNTAVDNQIQMDPGANWTGGLTSTPQPPGPQFVAGDFNADGKPDVFELRADGGYFCKPAYASGGLGCTKILTGDIRSAYDAYAGDFNADGKTDLLLIGDTDVLFCAGPGIAQANNCVQIPNASGWRSAFTVFTGDFNGDGKTDLYLVSDTTSYFCAGPGIASSNNCIPISTPNWKSSFTIVPGDFNGDGVTDFFLVGDTAEYFCAGPGLTTSNNCTALPGAYGWKSNYRVLTGDFNGDGVADLYLLGDGGSWLCAGPDIASIQDNCVQMSGPGNW